MGWLKLLQHIMLAIMILAPSTASLVAWWKGDLLLAGIWAIPSYLGCILQSLESRDEVK
jgi:hypothetical protein